MYMNYELLPATLGMHAQVEQRIMDGFVLAQQLAGFVDAQVSKYLGSTTRYIAVRRWQDKAAYDFWMASDQRKEYVAARRPELYSGPTVHWYFDQVLTLEGDCLGTFVASTALTLDNPECWDELVEQQQAHDRIVFSAGGLVSIQLYRDTADPSNARILLRSRSREDYERLMASDRMTAWRKELPAGLRTAEDAELYEVVREVVA